ETSDPVVSASRRRAATASARSWLVRAAVVGRLGGGAAGCWAWALAGPHSPAAAASGNRARTFTSDLLVHETCGGTSDRMNHARRRRGRQTAGAREAVVRAGAARQVRNDRRGRCGRGGPNPPAGGGAGIGEFGSSRRFGSVGLPPSRPVSCRVGRVFGVP